MNLINMLRNNAKKFQEENPKKIAQDIINKCEAVSKRGDYFFKYHYNQKEELPLKTIQILEEYGFKVQENDTYYHISWESWE